MSSVTVTTESLDQAASSLDDVHADLSALRSLPEADRQALGGSTAYQYFQSFDDTWSYGVSEIMTSVESLATTLRQASKTYRDTEGRITAVIKGSDVGTKTSSGKGGTATGTKTGTTSTGPASGTSPSGLTAKEIDEQVSKISDPRVAGHPQLQAFIESMALTSGLNPIVVAAWVIQEGGSATGGEYNYLNVGNTNSQFYGTGDSIWTNPTTAGKVTAEWLEGQDVVPGYPPSSPGVRGILKTINESGAAQVTAIQQSGWATSGEPDLPGIFWKFQGEVSG